MLSVKDKKKISNNEIPIIFHTDFTIITISLKQESNSINKNYANVFARSIHLKM